MRAFRLAAVLVISAVTAAVASQPVAKVQLPCDSLYQMLSPTGKQAVVACKDHRSYLVSIPDGASRPLLPAEPRVSALVYSKDGQWLAAGFPDGTVRVMPGQGTAAARQWKAGPHRIDTLYLFPDGKKLFVAPVDSPGTVWELTETPTLLATLPVAFGGMDAVAVSPDGELLVAAGDDTVLRWYDTATWQKMREYNGFLLETFVLTFTPDGKYLLAGGADSRITVLDPASGQQVRQLPPEAGSSVADIDFLGGPQRTLTLYFDNSGEKPPHALFWDLATDKSTPLKADSRPTCSGIVTGKLWLCNSDSRTLTILQQE